MKKTKILIPLDTSERSMHSINWLKKHFNKYEIDVTLMNVREIILTSDLAIPDHFSYLVKESDIALEKALQELEGYTADVFTTFGYASDEILRKVEEDSYDIIIMTRSTKKGFTKMIGSVTSKVLKNTHATVIVLPE